MKKIFLGMILLVLMFACYQDKDIIKVTGTMHYLTFEGGFWGIVGDDGGHYDPINLDNALKKEGLRVKFTLRILRDTGSFHMWGEVVEVLDWKII